MIVSWAKGRFAGMRAGLLCLMPLGVIDTKKDTSYLCIVSDRHQRRTTQTQSKTLKTKTTMNVSILEAARTKYWDLGVEDLHALRDALLSAIGQTSKDELQKQRGYLTSKRSAFQDRLYVGDATWAEHLGKDDQLINVVQVCGPITRGGGACSYGSIDHYHQVEYANSLPQTVGHIFLINTPGGAASARMDYKQAIDESRALGKPCVAFIDGMCCSAGMFIASQCDLIIVRNPKNEVGCIGTMVAFYTQKDGDTHQLSQERYVEITAEESPEKNLEYRQAAEGDYTLLKAELSRLTTEFQEMVREGRPAVTDEVLTGKVYAADEVLGQLADEIGNWQHAINCVFSLHDDMSQSRYGKKAEGEEDPEPKNDPAQPEQPEEPGEQPGSTEQNGDMECHGEEGAATTAETPATEEPATEQPATEESVPSGLPASEEQPATEEPVTEQPEEGAQTSAQEAQEAQEAAISAAVEAAVKDATANLQAQIDRQQQELEAARAEQEKLTKTIENQANDLAVAQKALQQATEQHEADASRIEELEGQMETFNNAAMEASTKLANVEKELEAAKTTIADRDEEIRILSESGTEAPVGSVPASNGQGVSARTPREANNVIKPGMSGKEARAAQEARMAELRRIACGG